MSIAQHKKALPFVQECVGNTDKVISNKRIRAEELDRTTGQVGSNTDGRNQRDDLNPLASRKGRKGLGRFKSSDFRIHGPSRTRNFERSQEMMTHGSTTSNGNWLLPGSLPVGIRNYIY